MEQNDIENDESFKYGYEEFIALNKPTNSYNDTMLAERTTIETEFTQQKTT